MSTLDTYLSVCFRLSVLAIIIFFVFNLTNKKPSGLIIVVALVILYLYTYFNGRMYLENFDDCRPVEQIVDKDEVILTNMSGPYISTPVDSADDFEYSNVFDNENDKELTKGLRNKLMSQYPMDWTVQPPSSKYFQQGLKEGFQGAPADLSGIDVIYKNVNGTNLLPPDLDSAEEKEREVLKTYVPKNANDLKTYDVDDAYTLIKNMYSVKGLVPTVEHTQDTNVYTIVGTRKIGEKVTFEDEGIASNDVVLENNEGTVKVPQAASDVLKDNDPFYNTQERTRQSKFDYTKFTPGLERTFSPTYPSSQWY